MVHQWTTYKICQAVCMEEVPTVEDVERASEQHVTTLPATTFGTQQLVSTAGRDA